jgi:hypothetical protein
MENRVLNPAATAACSITTPTTATTILEKEVRIP